MKMLDVGTRNVIAGRYRLTSCGFISDEEVYVLNLLIMDPGGGSKR
jgi:hypothetical protein